MKSNYFCPIKKFLIKLCCSSAFKRINIFYVYAIHTKAFALTEIVFNPGTTVNGIKHRNKSTFLNFPEAGASGSPSPLYT